MSKRIRPLLILGFVTAGLAACRLPLLQQPTPFVTPTPNLTMTALFSPTQLATLPPPPPATNTPPAVATSTPLPVPTNTPLPSPTTTPPEPTATPGRSGSPIEASFLSRPPTLDGVWDEWTSRAYPARFVVFGADRWSGPDDLETSFRIGWDEDYLYVAVKVLDEQYVQNSTGEDIFKGDIIEVLLDTNLDGDYLSQQLSSDDYQLGLSPGRPDVDGEKEAYLWFPAAKAGDQSDVTIAAVRSPGVYRLEARIPWSVFGIDPASGQRYGFALSASDNDNRNQNVQQSMSSSAEDRDLADPTTWGILVLR